MKTELSESQRRDLLELIINDKLMKTGDIKKDDRSKLEELGLIALAPHPTSKRTKRIVATEAAWAWAIDHFDEPFQNGSLRPREIWNGLAERLKQYLDRRGENLATFLADVSEPESPSEVGNGESVPDRLKAAYLRLTGGELRRRVRLTALRSEAAVDRTEADAALLALSRDDRIVLYPDDEQDRLTSEDHDAALPESGVPMHVIYWEE